jgi:hypothetical protein
VTVSRHCMVLFNETKIIIIGGEQRNGTFATGNTFLFDLKNKEKGWKKGPELKISRLSHSCGKIRTTQDDDKFSIIVVGGFQVWFSDFSTLFPKGKTISEIRKHYFK